MYTQHQPLLFQTMEGIVKGRLRDADYPLIGNHFQQGRLVYCGSNRRVFIFGMGENPFLENFLINKAKSFLGAFRVNTP